MKKQPEVTAATRQKIMDAFWKLYKEKAIEKISIAEITKITGNNRGTFYHYFKDVYAVLEQIEADLIKQVNTEVNEALRNCSFESNTRDINVLYSISTPIFKRHEEKIFTLLGKNGDPKFTDEFRESMRAVLIQFWNLPNKIEHEDYLMEYAYSAMIGLMAKWYENGNDLTDDEFFRMAQGLVANGILGYLKAE
ncbi:MAG: TetR/AcrR family transcriptional regulator [Oscillospiraceae bacterium]|nr:TetR/AcrR family transcriptional regulator [Oscillospiraceae bacterium]